MRLPTFAKPDTSWIALRWVAFLSSGIIGNTMTEFRATGLLRSANSLVIKIATAGLSYLMLVVLARVMDADAYGQFAFGLALATTLAVVAGLGQQTAILRYWQEDAASGRDGAAISALRIGAGLTLLAGVTVMMLTMAAAAMAYFVWNDWGGALVLASAALLIIPMAAAEYSSAALRAQGSVWLALAPKDLMWRSAVCIAAIAFFAVGFGINGPTALAITAGLLAAAVIAQSLAAHRRYASGATLRGVSAYWTARGQAGRWFWAGVVFDSAALSLDVIVVGLLVSDAATGSYFNAFRTAGLMTLFLFASGLVIAPIIARHVHLGELRKAQTVLSHSAWASLGFAALVFLAFLVGGNSVLALFGDHYADGHVLLMVLSVGFLVEAATGPARTTMVMTGHERAYALLTGFFVLLTGVLLVIAVKLFGLLGAAVVSTVCRVAARLVMTWYCVARINLNPSIGALVRLERPLTVRPSGTGA